MIIIITITTFWIFTCKIEGFLFDFSVCDLCNITGIRQNLNITKINSLTYLTSINRNDTKFI